MSRLHADPVDVVRRDDAPDQFLWRDRSYQVCEVLAHWVEAGRWWSAAGSRAFLTGDGVPGAARRGAAAAAARPSPEWARGNGDDPVPAASVASGPVVSDALPVDDRELEFWRVEARAGRAHGVAGLFDLCFDWSAGRWQLVKVVD